MRMILNFLGICQGSPQRAAECDTPRACRAQRLLIGAPRQRRNNVPRILDDLRREVVPEYRCWWKTWSEGSTQPSSECVPVCGRNNKPSASARGRARHWISECSESTWRKTFFEFTERTLQGEQCCSASFDGGSCCVFGAAGRMPGRDRGCAEGHYWAREIARVAAAEPALPGPAPDHCAVFLLDPSPVILAVGLRRPRSCL